MKVVNRLILAVSFMFASMANANIILSLDPSTQNSTSGGNVSVTVMVDGLGDLVPLSLASFDFNLEYDVSILSFTGYTLFDGLGDVGLEADDFSLGEVVAGSINIAELSYLFNFELWDSQPGSFALVELFFSVDAVGTSAISFGTTEFGDVNGDAINVTQVNNASITVPTPATLVLMGLALFIMFAKPKYKKSNITKY
jgi:hypothetical protein